MDDAFTQVAEDQFRLLTQLPWLMLAAFALPLIVAAAKLKIYPTVVWIALLCASLATSLATIFFPSAVLVVGIFDGVIVTIAAVDFMLLYLSTNQGITVTREMPRTCSLGVPLSSELTVENRTSLTLVGSICDDLPANFAPRRQNIHCVYPAWDE